MTNFGNDTLVIGSLKAFTDGSLGSATAWFLQPFDDQPNNSGLPSDELADPEKFYAELKAADVAGNHIATHAIGDRANKTILDLYERLEQKDGPADRRLRIEHARCSTGPEAGSDDSRAEYRTAVESKAAMAAESEVYAEILRRTPHETIHPLFPWRAFASCSHSQTRRLRLKAAP